MPSSAEGRSSPAILCRKAFKGRMGRARSKPAVRDRDVSALRGDAVQPDGQPVGEWVRRRLDAAIATPSGTDRWSGSDPRVRGRGCANAPGPEPAAGPRTAGSLPAPPSRSLRPPAARKATRKTLVCNHIPAASPVRTSGAPGCASAPHVVFAGAYGPDPRCCRCANHSVEDSWESADEAVGLLTITACALAVWRSRDG